MRPDDGDAGLWGEAIGDVVGVFDFLAEMLCDTFFNDCAVGGPHVGVNALDTILFDDLDGFTLVMVFFKHIVHPWGKLLQLVCKFVVTFYGCLD